MEPMNRDARLAATAPDRSPDRGEAIPLACHYLASIAEVISTGTSLFLPATLELLVEDQQRATRGMVKAVDGGWSPPRWLHVMPR
jgi:hypothetical protein